MTAKVTSRKLEVMVCGSVVVCVPTMPKALDSMPSTAREGGSVDKALVVQGFGSEFGSQVHVKKLVEWHESEV